MFLDQSWPRNRSRRLLPIVAICCGLATTVLGDFTDHFFEKPGTSSRALQRPDGNIWVIYEQPLNDRNLTNLFDVPRLFKTAIVRNNEEHIAGSDRLFETGNRFTDGFFAMAVQTDNKLLLGTETEDFLRLNPDGTLDTTFHPQVNGVVGTVLVQPDGKIIASSSPLGSSSPLVRLNPDGSNDSSFNSQLATTSVIALQSSGKIVVGVDSAPYLKRLNPDGSIDPTFTANLPAQVDSILRLPNDALLVRLFQFDSNGQTVFSLVRLNADGSNDAGFHPDSRFDNWYAVQPDGKVLAGFRDQAAGRYFLGRMNVDGSLDSSYQTYQVVVADANTLPISAVFVQPDGAILAEIIVPIEGQQFLRFSSSGVLDPASKKFFTIPAPVTKLVAQPDGKLLATGDFNFVDGVTTGPLIRLNNNGNLEGTIHLPPFATIPRGVDLDLQSNASILFSVTSGLQYPQMRLMPDGNVDPGFPVQNLGHHFKVRSDDRIVTADYNNVVRRLLSDGDVDSTFSPTQVSLGSQYGNFMAQVGLQPDGKMVVFGNGTFFSIHSIMVVGRVFRLNPDGGVDSSFDSPALNRVNCVAIQPDGKVLIGGRFVFADGSGIANLIRLNPNGSIDHTFVGVPDYTVSAILVERSGTILIGGGFSTVNAQPAARVARLEPDGQLDPTFTMDTRGGAVYALALLGDGRIVAGGEFGLVATAALVPARLRNISSRMFVDTGDNALIAGIIVAGSGQKKLLARAIGPSLAGAGITGPLSDPVLELRDSNGTLVKSNDDWQQSPDKQAIIDTGLPPNDSRESALIATLPANGSGYTALVRPARGSNGIGLIELYDLDPPESSARLANISSRGNVLGGDKAMISGFIVDGSPSMGPAKVIVRGLGPTIPLPGVLQDPTLELHDSSAVISSNNDWKETQQSDIEATGIPPSDDRESAVLRWVSPMGYTAVLRGKNDHTGIGLLEIYRLSE